MSSVNWRALAVTALISGGLVSGATSTARAADPIRVIPGLGSVVEGDAGSVVLEVPVRLSAASVDTVTVEWVTLFGPGVAPPDPAVPGDDFVAGSGLVTFVPGDVEEFVSVTVNGDEVIEPDEFVVLGFGNPTNAVLGGYWGLGFGVIEDDDSPPVIVPPTPWSSTDPGEISVVEGDAGSVVAQIPVRLSRPTTDTVTVDWTTSQIADSGIAPAEPDVDYEAASGTLTFEPGDVEESVPITVFGDGDFEPDEDIVLVFDNPTNAVMGGTTVSGGTVSVSSVLIVNDDDPPPPPIRVNPGLGSVVEGDAGSVVLEVPVRLSAASVDTVTVEWVTLFGPGVVPPDPAVPGDDFVAGSGLVTFVPGDVEEFVSVTVNGDEVIEPDEFVVLGFGNPTNAVLGGYWGLGFGIIEDDDTPPRLITVTPDTGVAGGDLVTVEGSGFTPLASIGVCQGGIVASADPPESACLQGAGATVTFTADADGNFSLPYRVIRRGYVPAVGGFVDCAALDAACGIGAAEVSDIAGTGLITPLSFAVPPPPPATLGAVAVTPSTDLVDGQTLAVTGSGFRADAAIEMYPCIGTDPGQENCSWDKKVIATADASGAFDASTTASRFLFGTQDCTLVACSFAAMESVDPVGTLVSTPISFAPPP